MLDMCIFFHKPQTRQTLQLAKACLEESCFSLMSQRVTSHATQVLINSVRVSTSSLPASCLKCLGCSPELLAAAKHSPGPRIQQQPKSLSQCMSSCYKCNCLDFAASGSSLPWSNQSTSTLLMPVWFCIYFPNHSEHLEDGVMLG